MWYNIYDNRIPSLENHQLQLVVFVFITAILKIVYYNGKQKSPRARSLNYAGNEYDFEYDFSQSMKNDENDIFLKRAILQRLRTYHAIMETVFEIC